MKMQEILGLEAKHRIQMEDRLSGAQEEIRQLRLKVEEVRRQKGQLESSRAALAIQLGAIDEDQVPLDERLSLYLNAREVRFRAAFRGNECLTCVASQAYSWISEYLTNGEAAGRGIGPYSGTKVFFETVLGAFADLDEQHCALNNAASLINGHRHEWMASTTDSMGPAVDVVLDGDGWWR